MCISCLCSSRAMGILRTGGHVDPYTVARLLIKTTFGKEQALP